MGISSSLGSSALLPAGLGFRNVLINGAMQVSQRSAVGTAVTGITTGGYKTADRWDLNMTTFGTWSQTCIADAPTGSGLRNSLKMACTSAYASPAAGNEMQIRQKLEGQNIQVFRKGTSSAKTFVLSFWVKSFQTGTFICELEDQDNSRNVSASYTVLASGVWEQKFITFPADSTGQFDNDSNSSLAVIWWIGAGSNFTSGTLATTWVTPTTANRAVGQTNVASSTNNYWQITGVQLEANLQPTPFEQRPIGIELALCQRYYEKEQTILQQMYWASDATGTVYGGSFVFNTAKRAAPSIKTYDAVNTVDRHSTFSAGASRTDNRSNNAVESSSTSFSVRGYAVAGAYGYGFYWTAESEL
jgi:hypothetical protein